MIDTRRLWEAFRDRVRQPDALTAIFAVLWCLVWLDAQVWFRCPPWFHALAFLCAAPVCIYWIRRTWPWTTTARCSFRLRNLLRPDCIGTESNVSPVSKDSVIRYRAVISVSYIPAWQFIAHLPLVFSAYSLSASICAGS